MVISFTLAFLVFLVALASEIAGAVHSRRMAEIYDWPTSPKESWSSMLMRPLLAFLIILFVCEVAFPS